MAVHSPASPSPRVGFVKRGVFIGGEGGGEHEDVGNTSIHVRMWRVQQEACSRRTRAWRSMPTAGAAYSDAAGARPGCEGARGGCGSLRALSSDSLALLAAGPPGP